MKSKIEKLSKENLQDILLEMLEILSEKQYKKLEIMIEDCITGGTEYEKSQSATRMPQEQVDEKMESVIHFAKDCVDDRRYQEANFIYEWLWEMYKRKFPQHSSFQAEMKHFFIG